MNIQQEINNDNSLKTVKSRLTFLSAFSLMVTVTLTKTAVAKNLSQSIIICVEHQNFSKSIRRPCQYPILGGFPGIPWLPLRHVTEFTIVEMNENVPSAEMGDNNIIDTLHMFLIVH